MRKSKRAIPHLSKKEACPYCGKQSKPKFAAAHRESCEKNPANV